MVIDSGWREWMVPLAHDSWLGWRNLRAS
jgi:hypothetical protein